MSDKPNGNQTKKRPQYSFGLEDPPEPYAKRHRADTIQATASDKLLDTQNYFLQSLKEIEQKWTADHERDLKRKLETQIKLQAKHEAKLDLQEENRKALAESEGKLRARLLEELRPEIEKEVRAKITKEMEAVRQKELREVETRIRDEYEDKLKELRGSFS